MRDYLLQYKRNGVTKDFHFVIDHIFLFSRLDIDQYEQWQKYELAGNPDVYMFEGNADLMSESYTINILCLIQQKGYNKNCAMF